MKVMLVIKPGCMSKIKRDAMIADIDNEFIKKMWV